MTNIEELLFRFRWQIALILIGLILAAGGIFLSIRPQASNFELVDGSRGDSTIALSSNLIVEVSGAVNSPGVFELASDARVEDALNSAGGINEEAESIWVEKYLNRAAFVTDGQKIYIPWQGEAVSDSNQEGYQTGSEVLSSVNQAVVNINTASQSELESLPGIGPVYAQKVIDNRPYSDVSELLVKKAVTQKIYNENYERLSVY